MTDKIIIDGVDVSECEYINCCDKKTKCIILQDDICADSQYCKGCNCYYKQLKRKQQECEELKSDLTELSKIIDCKNGTILTFKAKLNQLKKTNEELRKCYKNNSALLDFEETNTTKLVNKVMKLEQTLIEIKEIAKNMNKECFYDDFDCKDCDMKNGCTYQGKIKILQKISEVENDRI